MKNKITTLLFSLNICAAFAQQPVFTKAYVVTLKNDTIRGEAQLNPKKPLFVYEKVVFRDSKGVQKNYKPEKIKAYGVDSLNFISLMSDGEPRFYKVLAAGAINLYEMSFEYQQGKEILLESEYYLSYPENKRLVIVKQNKFKKQIADWMKDDPDIVAKYEDEKEFNLPQAIAIIKEFNSIKRE